MPNDSQGTCFACGKKFTLTPTSVLTVTVTPVVVGDLTNALITDDQKKDLKEGRPIQIERCICPECQAP